MLAAKTTPRIRPTSVPTTPMAAPTMKKMRCTAPPVAPMVRRMAMSRPLSLTSIVRLETTFNAATPTMSVRMMNMTLRSTSIAPKNWAFCCSQSTIRPRPPTTPPITARAARTASGSATTISMPVTPSPRRKYSCAALSGMNT